MQFFELFLHGKLDDNLLGAGLRIEAEQQVGVRKRLELADLLYCLVPTMIIDLRMRCLADP